MYDSLLSNTLPCTPSSPPLIWLVRPARAAPPRTRNYIPVTCLHLASRRGFPRQFVVEYRPKRNRRRVMATRGQRRFAIEAGRQEEQEVAASFSLRFFLVDWKLG